MPRRKKCNTLKCKVTNFIQERRRLKAIEYKAYLKEKERKQREMDKIRKRDNARKAAEKGKGKAARKYTVKPQSSVSKVLKPSGIQTGINMSLSKPVEDKVIKNKTVLKTNTAPIMTQPSSYIQVNTVKSGGVNKYPVTWKSANSSKYNRLWFSSLQEAEQFASTKSREMRIRVDRINAELGRR